MSNKSKNGGINEAQPDCEYEIFMGLRVYPIREGGIHTKKYDRASHCFHARCHIDEIQPIFHCSTCLYSIAHNETFLIWAAHKRLTA